MRRKLPSLLVKGQSASSTLALDLENASIPAPSSQSEAPTSREIRAYPESPSSTLTFRPMNEPSPPNISHRHSIDSPYNRSFASSRPQYATPSTPPLPDVNNRSNGTPYDTLGRRISLDSDVRTRQPSSSSESRVSHPPTPDRSRNSSSSLFTRKLLKKNRTNSYSSSISSPTQSTSSPLPSPSFTSSPPPPLSNSSSFSHPSPYMKPQPYAPSSHLSYPSPYPSYYPPQVPPGDARPPPAGHRSSMTSNRNFTGAAETEEEQVCLALSMLKLATTADKQPFIVQLARIQLESLELEQQRQIDLEAEEERLLQQALAESAALAEQERIRSQERERLRRMEEEIAMREALVFSREFEQAEAERIAQDRSRIALEEEKEMQRVLARSRTVNRGWDRAQDQRETEAFEAATRPSLGNPEGRESNFLGTPTRASHDYLSERGAPGVHSSEFTADSTPASPTRSPYTVANPDASSSIHDDSDGEGPPPSYTLVDPDAQTEFSGVATSNQAPATDSSRTAYTYTSPRPPTGAAPAVPPRHISTGYATYQPSASSEQSPHLQSFDRADSTVATVGSAQTESPSSAPLFEAIALEDSIPRPPSTEQGTEDPFDDAFEADDEEPAISEEIRNGRPGATESISDFIISRDGLSTLPEPPIIVQRAPSQTSNSSTVSPNLIPQSLPFPSPSMNGLCAPEAPAPIRRVSEPPPSVSNLLPDSAGPPLTSHSENNTPEPSPGLDSYPNAPSFGGIVEDPTPSCLATAEYVTEGIRWGFVSVERASLHPPLESRGAFPQGAQLSSATNEEGKQQYMSFAIEAKSWSSLMVYLTWCVDRKPLHSITRKLRN